mgnify:CR=1 FL=1
MSDGVSETTFVVELPARAPAALAPEAPAASTPKAPAASTRSARVHSKGRTCEDLQWLSGS